MRGRRRQAPASSECKRVLLSYARYRRVAPKMRLAARPLIRRQGPRGSPLPVLTGRGRGWGSSARAKMAFEASGSGARPTPYLLPARTEKGIPTALQRMIAMAAPRLGQLEQSRGLRQRSSLCAAYRSASASFRRSKASASSIRPGEILALVGENGAGKSTLVRILEGVHQPDQGSLEVGGSTRRRFARRATRTRTASG